MQLKLQRSQRQGGVVSKSVIFRLDARVDYTPEEKQSIARYKLQNEVIYNSEAQKRLIDKGAAHQDGTIGGGLKSLATFALAHLKLHITIGSLERGQHIECKSLDELLGAEEALMAACQNLKSYLDTALTFDGREVVIDFATGVPAIVAQAVSPTPMLAIPAPPPPSRSRPAPAMLAGPAVTLDTPSDTYDTEADGSENYDRDFMLSIDEMFDTPARRYTAIGVGLVILFLTVRACAG